MASFPSRVAWLVVLPLAPLVAGCGSSSSGTTPKDAGVDHATGDAKSDVQTAATANLLISDQYNNRVIEVTRKGDIVWSFGDGKSVAGPTSVVAPNAAERIPNAQTLIAGSGAAPGAEPTCPATDGGGGGCPDNRVIIVDDATGKIVWQYGENGGVSGSGPNQLNTPVHVAFLAVSGKNHVIITDQGNNRIIEVDQTSKDIVWTYPPTGATTDQMLNSPNSAQRLTNGHTVIADEGGNRAIEVTTAGDIVWQYPPKVNTALLNSCAFASRLPNGHTLITDANNARVLEVDDSTPPKVVWTFLTGSRNVNMPAPETSCAVRLSNGDTLVTDQLNDQVIEVDSTTQQNIVYTYGKLGVAGNTAGELNAPYAALDIGDYTGLTAP